jgi:gamma-glutamyltranspeptidase/glutathione hydrolase
MLLNPFSSAIRPALGGRFGAIAAAHPLAVAAGQMMLARGGSAVDAMIAAQAVLCVVAPDACGLGGDAFALVRDRAGRVTAVNGAGAASARASRAAGNGGASVTVPGIVDAWCLSSARWGRLDLADVLEPARRLAAEGMRVDPSVARARDLQAPRLRAGGAAGWALMAAPAGGMLAQPELAHALAAIAAEGRAGFYAGPIGAAIIRAVRDAGGSLDQTDLDASAAQVLDPVSLDFAGWRVHVQPPQSQGVLLAMALNGWERGGFATRPGSDPDRDHLAAELTQAAFGFRDAVGRGAALLAEPLAVDPARASGRGGPRSYLHTAGVAAADAEGGVAVSLVSVFDDFGSGVFVPEGGFVLNNRAGGFTSGENAFLPGARPVHTLAPALVETPEGAVGLATPGADGQVQTLLQVILNWRIGGAALPEAVAAPRWRSEDGRLLVEEGHPARALLLERGHEIVDLPTGEMRFGALSVAGIHGGAPFALADWRRMTWAGVA